MPTDSHNRSKNSPATHAGSEVSDLSNRVRAIAETRPYVAILSALTAGFLLARLAARGR